MKRIIKKAYIEEIDVELQLIQTADRFKVVTANLAAGYTTRFFNSRIEAEKAYANLLTAARDAARVDQLSFWGKEQ